MRKMTNSKFPKSLFLVCLFIFCQQSAVPALAQSKLDSEAAQSVPSTEVDAKAGSESKTVFKRKAKYFPYAPEKREYYAEVGGMWENDNAAWFGLTYGRHAGRCFIVNSEVCQQFVDFTGGAGTRDDLTIGNALVGLRWQYVSWPQPVSPSLRLFVGGHNIRDDRRDRLVGTYGVGLGLTAKLNPKFDVKVEARIGEGDLFWAQTFVSFSLKIDRFVEDFSSKVIGFGESTVRNTGQVIKSTIMAPKTLVDWFNSPNVEKSVYEENGSVEDSEPGGTQK